MSDTQLFLASLQIDGRYAAIAFMEQARKQGTSLEDLQEVAVSFQMALSKLEAYDLHFGLVWF